MDNKIIYPIELRNAILGYQGRGFVISATSIGAQRRGKHSC